MRGSSRWLSTFAGAVLLLAAPLGAGEVRGNADCGDRCGDFVVFVDGVGGSWERSGEVAELGQKNKIFVPHVVPLLAGSILRVGNDDPFLHNVHGRKDGKTMFNFNVLFQYQTVDQPIVEAGIYRIHCEPHPEMSAVLVALENPYFVKPDEDGGFVIPGVPAGSYELVRLDAEKERRRSRRIEVGRDPVQVDF